MKKRILYFLISVLVLLYSFSIIGYGENLSKEFVSSYQSSSCFSLKLKDNSIIFENIPEGNEFSYFYVSLKSENNKEYKKTFFSKNSFIKKTRKIPLKGLNDGIYYLQIFTSPVRYGTYKSFYFKNDIPITISNGNCGFKISPVYELNKLIKESKRTDKTALSYYLKPSLGVQSDNKDIINLSKKITYNLKTDLEKAYAIHNWVRKNIYYDFDMLNSKNIIGDTSALGTLNSKKSICQGYASLCAALLRASGIPAKLVSGYALGIGEEYEFNEQNIDLPANHVWNEAFVNGRWIITDAAWDSPNVYKNGKFEVSEMDRNILHFDPTLQAFSITHRIDDYSENDIPNHNYSTIKKGSLY